MCDSRDRGLHSYYGGAGADDYGDWRLFEDIQLRLLDSGYPRFVYPPSYELMDICSRLPTMPSTIWAWRRTGCCVRSYCRISCWPGHMMPQSHRHAHSGYVTHGGRGNYGGHVYGYCGAAITTASSTKESWGKHGGQRKWK